MYNNPKERVLWRNVYRFIHTIVLWRNVYIMHPTKARIIIQKKSPMKECIGKDSMPSLLLFFQHCCSRTDYLAWQIRFFPKERLSDFYSNGRIHSSFVLLIRTWNLYRSTYTWKAKELGLISHREFLYLLLLVITYVQHHMKPVQPWLCTL